jgi:hypothetical protein
MPHKEENNGKKNAWLAQASSIGSVQLPFIQNHMTYRVARRHGGAHGKPTKAGHDKKSVGVFTEDAFQ